MALLLLKFYAIGFIAAFILCLYEIVKNYSEDNDSEFDEIGILPFCCFMSWIFIGLYIYAKFFRDKESKKE